MQHKNLTVSRWSQREGNLYFDSFTGYTGAAQGAINRLIANTEIRKKLRIRLSPRVDHCPLGRMLSGPVASHATCSTLHACARVRDPCPFHLVQYLGTHNCLRKCCSAISAHLSALTLGARPNTHIVLFVAMFVFLPSVSKQSGTQFLVQSRQQQTSDWMTQCWEGDG